MKLIAHKAQVVLVEAGTVVEDETGRGDTVTTENGVQIGNTFFMTEESWNDTSSKDSALDALVLRPVA